MAGDHVGDLDDGIDLCLWEDALAPGTLDIKTEYSQGCDFLPLVFRCMGDEVVPSVGVKRQDSESEAGVAVRQDALPHADFNLTVRLLFLVRV